MSKLRLAVRNWVLKWQASAFTVMKQDYNNVYVSQATVPRCSTK